MMMILPATIFIITALIDKPSTALSTHCVEGSHCKDGECGDFGCLSGCENGYFGSHCTNNCSSGCKDGTCDSSGKACTGDCIDGRWGTVCRLKCFSSCKTCAKDNGSDCTSCEEYRYGPHCGQSCSSKCPKRGCDINGRCKSRCSDRCKVCNEITQECDGCKRGTFGPVCQWRCNVNCADEVCHQETANCSEGCKDEYFGPKCEYRCNEQCFQGKCQQGTGMCAQGCKRGYYGSDCILPCDSCLANICDNSSGECLKGCKMGFFGKGCKNRCDANCISGYCSRFDGVCYQPEVPVPTNATPGGTNFRMYIVGGCIGVLLCSAACFLVIRYRVRIRGNHQQRGVFRQNTPLPPVPIPHDDLYDELDTGHSDTDSRPSALDEAGDMNVDLCVDMSSTDGDKDKRDPLMVSAFGNVCPKIPGQETKSQILHVETVWLTETDPTAGDVMRTDRAASIDLDERLHVSPCYTSLCGRARPSINYLSPVEECNKA
ncbi:multiple epidermal growth factor-like domains protein 10 [Haliotis asinina]|uniref:multiple epidermal growth factor-like domains protein 10 n=1 Tax=Haliotis asinina TaxID=109174 RepID=UPI003531F045